MGGDLTKPVASTLRNVTMAEHKLLDIDEKLTELDKAIAARAADLLSQREILVRERANWALGKAEAEKDILGLMESSGERSLEVASATVSVRKGVQSVVVDDESEVPAEFKETVFEEKIDKTRLKAHLVAHPDDQVGAHLQRGRSKLVIKYHETEISDEF